MCCVFSKLEYRVMSFVHAHKTHKHTFWHLVFTFARISDTLTLASWVFFCIQVLMYLSQFSRFVWMETPYILVLFFVISKWRLCGNYASASKQMNLKFPSHNKINVIFSHHYSKLYCGWISFVNSSDICRLANCTSTFDYSHNNRFILYLFLDLDSRN